MTPSPCVRECLLQDNVCWGCQRTREEITGWRDYTDEQKLNVLNRIEEKRYAQGRQEDVCV